jgi:hypothetical protein
VVGNDVGGRPKDVWPEKNAKIRPGAKVNNYDYQVECQRTVLVYFFKIRDHLLLQEL